MKYLRVHFATLCVGLALLVGGVIAWKEAPRWKERSRLASIQQTLALTGSIQMRVEDLWLYPTEKHELIRVPVRYLGGNPNDDYSMRAEVGRSAKDQTFRHIKHWQVGLKDNGPTDILKCWEFADFPRDGSPLTIRIFMRPKNGGPEVMRHFTIPDRPKLTPNGETKANVEWVATT